MWFLKINMIIAVLTWISMALLIIRALQIGKSNNLISPNKNTFGEKVLVGIRTFLLGITPLINIISAIVYIGMFVMAQDDYIIETILKGFVKKEDVE